MAKYTETLADYLAGGRDLPAEFALIEGFDKLFVGKYVDHELGFETEDLFEIKLELKAALVIPIYKERLDQLNAAIARESNAAKTVAEMGSDTAQKASQRATSDQVNAGEQNGSVTELPIYADVSGYEAEPNRTQHTDAFINSSTHNESENDSDNRSHQYTRTESGLSLYEAYEIVRSLERDVFNLKSMLLNEFAGLFMGVY